MYFLKLKTFFFQPKRRNIFQLIKLIFNWYMCDTTNSLIINFVNYVNWLYLRFNPYYKCFDIINLHIFAVFVCVLQGFFIIHELNSPHSLIRTFFKFFLVSRFSFATCNHEQILKVGETSRVEKRFYSIKLFVKN